MLNECKRKVLPNGLRVLGVENPALHSFVCSVYVRAGPRFESREETGLTHLLEHMVMQGSEKYPTSNAIMRGVEDLGGVIDGATYPEYVNFSFGVHRKHWRKLMDIAGDVLRRPLFAPAALEKEKLVVAQEISHHRDQDGRNISASELGYCLFFKGCADEAGTRGTPALLGRFDGEVVTRFYRRFFAPANMVVCLAGGFDFGEVMESVAESLGQMEAGAGPNLLIPPAPFEPARAFYRFTESLPVADALLWHRGYALGDPSLDAARAINHALGGGLSSRLFTRVREELGLVYDISSHLQGHADTGSLGVFLSVSVENLVQAVAAALDVVARTAEEGLTEAELARYKESVRCGMDMLCDRATHLADWFGRQELLLGPDGVTTPREYVRRQEALTLEQLAQVARHVLTDEPKGFVVVGPYGEEERARLRELFLAREADACPAPEPPEARSGAGPPTSIRRDRDRT